ncbi:MAG: hypothetical protein WD534_11300 [Phycisphaeraceae bacterium]
MAFKAMDSFLRFVTMGAMATHHVWALLEQRGYQIIELERYAGSNKIWQKKVKRLRLPDLMCVKTGVRFEVRAKSNLKIEMSHAPANVDRHWDAGLRDQDVVILVKAFDDEGNVRLGEQINAFRVASLRACQDDERVGGPKASSEGSERTITWPAWVPSADGAVETIEHNLDGTIRRVRVRYDDDRSYTYSRMEGKHVYLREGERFSGDEQFVLGLPDALAPLDANESAWSPVNDLDCDDAGDRLAAVKAYLRLDPAPVVDRLQRMLADEQEDLRIRLEVAGVLARHNFDDGLTFLADHALQPDGDAAWVMEAVFILSELSDTPQAAEVLRMVVADGHHAEARAAAAWGLGETPAGLPTLLKHLGDADENVAAHAVVAASRIVQDAAPTRAVCALFDGDERAAASASELLARAEGADLGVLLEQASAGASETTRRWAFASLARRKAAEVRAHPHWSDQDEQLRQALESAWFGPEHSWLTTRDAAAELNTLELQRYSTHAAFR